MTVNHDLKLLRLLFNWGVRKGYLARSPLMIGTHAAIRLEREIPRDRRFASDDDETRVLDAANPHLRAVITAMLDTACRPGEILSLQRRDVDLDRRELLIRAPKAKTRTTRLIPLSKRLLAVLEMRCHDPAGRPLPPDGYVFGDPLGHRIKSVRNAWRRACERAGLQEFELRDLRHEAASRFEEAGVSITYVSKLLGHTNLTTTSRYLNIHRRGLHRAMAQYEQAREARQLAKDCQTETKRDVQPTDAQREGEEKKSLPS